MVVFSPLPTLYTPTFSQFDMPISGVFFRSKVWKTSAETGVHDTLKHPPPPPPPNKNVPSSCCTKPVCISFFCWTQKKILKNVGNQIDAGCLCICFVFLTVWLPSFFIFFCVQQKKETPACTTWGWITSFFFNNYQFNNSKLNSFRYFTKSPPPPPPPPSPQKCFHKRSSY